jgi:4-amino-4-deoxy-L-arabinose transferase-like glycosyltransferase
VALGLLVRIAYTIPAHVALGDQSCYVWLGRSLFAGDYTYYCGQPEVHFPPLFPIILGVLDAILRDGELALKASYLIFGGLLPIPVYRLARDIHGPKAARLAAGLVAILPALVVGSLFQTLSETPFLFFLAVGLSFLYRAASGGSVGLFALTGVSLSLGYLVRPEGYLFLLVAILYAIISFAGRGELALRADALRRAALRLGALVGAFALVAAPYVVYLCAHGNCGLSAKSVTSYVTTRGLVTRDGRRFQKDTWGLSESGEVRYFERHFDKGLLEVLRSPEYRDRVWPDIKANSQSAYHAMINRRVFGRILLALSLLGLVAAPWDRKRLHAEVLCFLVVAYIGSVLIFFVNDRFLYPLLIPASLWAARGMEHILGWIEGSYLPGVLGKRPFRRGAQGAFLLLLAAVLIAYGRREFVEKARLHWEVLDAAAWLRANTPADAVVMTAGTETALAADRTWLPVPVGSREAIVKYGTERGASYLVLRGFYIFLRDEQRSELWEGAKDYPGLRLVAKEGEMVVEEERLVSSHAFVVYKIEKEDTP